MSTLQPRGVPIPAFGMLGPTLLVLVLSWVFGGGTAYAQAGIAPRDGSGFESLDRIRSAAVERARALSPPAAQLKAGHIDSRLRLAACPQPLSTAAQAGPSAALSVEVRCDAAGWKLYVPVGVSVQVPVLVATRGLVRGDRLGDADVEIQMRERAGLGLAWLSSLDQLEGRVAARNLPAGSVLAPGALSAARLIRRGQSVTIIGQSPTFQVRATGKALADAAAGELLRVENLSSRRVVQGQVLADGSVRVGL